MLNELLDWDRETFIYLNGLGIEQYDFFWSTITTITTWVPLFLLFAFLLLKAYPKKQGLYSILTVLVLFFFVLTLTDLTKEIVARLRPNNDVDINGVIRIIKNSKGYSFFSGHASSSFSITTIIVLFLRKKYPWVFVFYLWAFLFTISRIYVGVHFPIDLMVGALVGTVSALFFYWLHGKLILPYLGLDRHE
ncbi:phosphatase PAP2 family protein [Maribacter chungangensis]|uniref:Phosphatase PAP2 family protein n=1 Tax=Maribacter chungangensis TaxID=1069117 RepID=A0ABW3B8D8_9FLAO